MSNVRHLLQRIFLTTMKPLRLLVVLAALASGCAHDPNPHAKTSQSLAVEPGAPFGMVVASVGHDSSTPYAASHIVFQRDGAPGGGVLIYQPRYMVPSPTDFETSRESGTVLVTKLPPGKYNIVGIGALWHAGINRFTPSIRLAEPIPFSVSNGAVTYLGRYVIGKSGASPVAAPTLRIESSADADMKVGGQRTPELAQLARIQHVVRVGQVER